MDDDQIIDPTTARALQADVARSRSLYGWAVWRDAPDYSGKVIGRLVTDKPTPYVLIADSLSELQAQLPPGLERFDRRVVDLPELVEVWLAAETVQKVGGQAALRNGRRAPTLRDGIIPVERTVHNRGPNFQHQMSAPRRPPHLLLGVHSPMQQPLHRAFGDRRRNWFFASAGCRVVDDNIGLSRHVLLEIAQQARHLAHGSSHRRRIVGCNVHCNDGFGNEI